MNISLETIDCQTYPGHADSRRTKPFLIAKIEFFGQSNTLDKIVLRSIREQGQRLAAVVNSKAANDSTAARLPTRRLNNAIAGVLAEYCWRHFLNSVSTETLVTETPFAAAAHQIDLQTLHTGRSIEVRSSFPRNGVAFAICSSRHEFDILGPYKNDYKPDEIQKDFYLRTLYHLPTPLDFLNTYQHDGFCVYLTGGATWAMMADDAVAVQKTLLPEDDLREAAVESVYRVVPFSRALDTGQMVQAIRQATLAPTSAATLSSAATPEPPIGDL